MDARFLLLMLVGCGDSQDLDGDGFPRATDCDDDDAGVYPGAPEACDADAVDSDCDDLPDDADPDAPRATFFPDLDGDGFGRAGAPLEACVMPDRYVTDDQDCDDARDDVFPGAAETCDGLDGDCDGLGDDADPDVATSTWHLDADGDGFGSAADTVTACAVPDGYVADATDCDDGDDGTWPGAEDECGGGDADCDGFDGGCALEGEVPLSNADATLVGEGPGDRAGAAIAVLDVDGDATADLVTLATGADGTFGALYLARGPFSGARNLREADLRVTGDTEPFTTLAAGDLDGDGLDDIVAGAPSLDGVWIFGAARRGEIGAGEADAVLLGSTSGDELGAALAAGDDLDGDGVGDLVVGAPGASSGDLSDAGVVFIYGGATTGSIADASLTAAISGAAAGTRFGAAVALPGDLDGDGTPDLVIGASDDDTAGPDAGAVRVFYGPLTGAINVGDADAMLTGVASWDEAGASVAGVGDVNGDGARDLMVGAPSELTLSGGGGVAYLVFAGTLEATTLADTECRLVAPDAEDGAGATLGALGDVSGDGKADVAIGGADADRVWLAQGPFAGTITLTYVEGALLEHAAGDEVGAALAGGGDLDGDGLLDVVVGSPGNDTGGSAAGLVSILRGWED